MVRRKAKTDKVLFAKTFLPHLLKCKTPAFHHEIYALLDQYARVAIASPRSFAKSTIVAIINVLHKLLYGEAKDILILSNSGTLSEEWVRKVRTELEMNEKIIQAFGDQRNDDKWTNEHLLLKNGNQLRGKGRGYQIRGFRPTDVICDDLEDDEMVRSKDQRDKLLDWFLGALINTLEPNQQLTYIGTLLHPLSLLKRIVTEDDPMFEGWTKRLYQAIVKDDVGNEASIWPEKWSLEDLKIREGEIGTHKFQAEYMNNPVADSMVIFHPDTYQYYTEMPTEFEGKPEEIEQIICGFDLVGSAREFEGKDYVAMVTLAKLKLSKRIYLMDARRGHWTQEQIVNQLIDVYKNFAPNAFVAEKVSFAQIVSDYLIRECRDRKVYLPVYEIELGTYTDKRQRKAKDKVSRAQTVQHIFTQGLFYMPRGLFRDFYEELSVFPAGDYDDQVDSMVHALHVLTERVPLHASQGTVDWGVTVEKPLGTTSPKTRFAKDGIILEDVRGGL